MDKVKSRFTKIGRPVRTFSTSNYDPSSPASKKRTKSMSSSEFLDSDHTPSPPHQLTYHGYMCVDDPKSNKDVLNALRTARGSLFKNMVVTLSHGQGTLRVAEGSGDAILVCPLHSVALVRREGGQEGGKEEGGRRRGGREGGRGREEGGTEGGEKEGGREGEGGRKGREGQREGRKREGRKREREKKEERFLSHKQSLISM